jgi:acetylornithine/succinyldiaminopimelate/putrescine aminotransferase
MMKSVSRAEDALQALAEIRKFSGEMDTIGLSNDVIASFCEYDKSISEAIAEGLSNHRQLRQRLGDDVMMTSEPELVSLLQEDYVNFYAPATVNPYIALAARGPWIITSHGAVVHDNGGYGMLGAGHGPSSVIDAMSQNWVMANVMTPSFSHSRLAEALKQELGHSRGHCPFTKFICMNSGSESMTVALRIADINANTQTGPGGKYENYPIKMVAVERSFHGRTDRPAQISHSCKSGYDKNLATFQNRDNLILVPANDPKALEAVFQQAVEEKFFIELIAIEPIQGEGNPGMCVTREFYDTARRLTKEYDSMLLVDSIQAGIRGQGCLSVIDYDGFQDAEVPDMETWSKAINAGQYPLSVLGMNDGAASMYVVGIYGNTMTTNPRALETAVAVLEQITPELRMNIKDRGEEFVMKLKILADELPGTITKVQGTGLLLSAELEPGKFPVVGFDAVEPWCRRRGLGVIHGGHNALRFTPHFRITSKEIDLIIDIVREALIEFSR